MSIKDTKGEKTFYAINYVVLVLIGLTTLLPFLHVLAKSISGEAAVISGSVSLLPKDIQFGTYHYVVSGSQFPTSFGVSVFITVVGTLLAMILTVLCAYPLSKPQLVGRKWLMLSFIFIMLFHGGIIPNYLLYRTLKITNTVWAMIIPMMLNVFNMLIIKNFFEQLPESVEESAQIEGAGNLRILFQVVLPMATPVLATISLFFAVAYWNNFFFALIYITDPDLKPLQLYLYEVVTTTMLTTEDLAERSIDDNMNLTGETVLAATVMLTTIPILVVYPFLQRYFVKGIVIGSVKG